MLPTRLLIHSCRAIRAGEIDRDGNVGASIEWALSNVRIEPTKAVVYADAGVTKADALTLFYDHENSNAEPAGYIPQELDVIHWEGHDYTIRSVKFLYTQGRGAVHHYEAALV